MLYVLGIDPGKDGGIACLSEAGMVTHPMPATEADVWELVRSFNIDVAYLEQVHAMPKQGVTSSFTFGQGYGFLRGVLTGLGVRWEQVTPQKWQKSLGCLSKGDKNVTKAAAQRLWPAVKFTHKTADAALIAEYGYRIEVQRRLAVAE